MNEGEEKYKRSGFTFKSGLLFYGQPGCGKTSTIKAILKYTNRHGIILNLSRVKTCEELEMIFRNRVINKRELTGKQICFILEDCDAFENNICMAREYNEQKPITQIPSANEFLKVVPESEQSSSDLFLQMMCKKTFIKMTMLSIYLVFLIY
jgi:DNA polymerase III delta prime subunit